MRLNNINKSDLEKIFACLKQTVEAQYHVEWIKYVDLGVKTVRIINFSKAFTSHVEKQLTYTLKDEASQYDTTIIIWHEKDSKKVSDTLLPHVGINPHRIRLEKLRTKMDYITLTIIDETYSKHNSVLNINVLGGLVEGYDEASNTYFYGVENLEPEEFIKQGHIFVQMFNKITRTETSNLVHGALVGLNGEGVLFCARGQRGKSTLSVLSMMKGFEYVSDDYLILEKEGDTLYTHPIYSIITLSPRMYNELYAELEGSRFVSNNARKDKYVINIENFHPIFRTKYPVKFCMFPQIVEDKNPSIVPCPKGRAITQLIHSTVNQVQDMNNTKTIKKLLDMVKDFEFYQINLCADVYKNTECLRNFIENYEQREKAIFNEDPMYVDVTFDLAHILDSENGVIYSMNKFATQVYEFLQMGISPVYILEELQKIEHMPESIAEDLRHFTESIVENKILHKLGNEIENITFNQSFIKECRYKLSLLKFTEQETINFINKPL